MFPKECQGCQHPQVWAQPQQSCQPPGSRWPPRVTQLPEKPQQSPPVGAKHTEERRQRAQAPHPRPPTVVLCPQPPSSERGPWPRPETKAAMPLPGKMKTYAPAGLPTELRPELEISHKGTKGRGTTRLIPACPPAHSGVASLGDVSRVVPTPSARSRLHTLPRATLLGGAGQEHVVKTPRPTRAVSRGHKRFIPAEGEAPT